MPSEFDIIQHYFSTPANPDKGVVLGTGDDAAILRPPAGHDLVMAVDTIIAGRHFPQDTPADAIGYRALAVNLSDLAAMGAKPAWAVLALTLPDADESWLAEFMQGFNRLAEQTDLLLVGGDTTRGPLSVTVTVQGFVPSGKGLRRDGAKPGDLIYVSDTPGQAAAGLAVLQNKAPKDISSTLKAGLLQRFLYPEPRLALGQYLLDKASAAIDVSDGLLADLTHILTASQVGASLDIDNLSHPDVCRIFGEQTAKELALGGGDDYELCFTLPRSQVERIQAQSGNAVRCIGIIEAETGVRLRKPDSSGPGETLSVLGFDHFMDQ